jgi:hypothetical protein
MSMIVGGGGGGIPVDDDDEVVVGFVSGVSASSSPPHPSKQAKSERPRGNHCLNARINFSPSQPEGPLCPSNALVRRPSSNEPLASLIELEAGVLASAPREMTRLEALA